MTAPAATGKKRLNFRKLALRIGIMVVAIYVGACLLLYFLQPKLLYHPMRELEATPAAEGLSFEDVTLVASDGVKLDAWYMPAFNARATLLFCHGNAGNISHRLDSFRIFHDLGLNVFIFDYRGYGKSEGSPTEEGTCLDAEAAWKWLTEVKGVPDNGIILFGRSLGGAVAANLASKHRPAALILESTFTSMPALAGEFYPLLPVRAICRYRYDTRSLLPTIGCPVLVVHSIQDDLVPYRQGKELFESAHEPKSFLRITGTHNSGHLTSGAAYVDGLNDFLTATLNDGGLRGEDEPRPGRPNELP